MSEAAVEAAVDAAPAATAAPAVPATIVVAAAPAAAAVVAAIPPAVEAKQLRPHNSVTWKEKKEAAVLRVRQKIGQDAMDAIKSDWALLDSGNGKKDQEKGNEIIIALCNLKLSQIEILSMLGCGSERISKMRLRIAQGDDFVNRTRKPPSHAFKEPTLKYLYDFMEQWETEVSVTCQHHTNKHIVEQGITWKTLHERYQEGYSTLSPAMKEEIEFMKYSTFTQYIHQKNPGLSLSRPKQDVCLVCSELIMKEQQAASSASSSAKPVKIPAVSAAVARGPASLKRKAAAQLEKEEVKENSDSEDDVTAPAASAAAVKCDPEPVAPVAPVVPVVVAPPAPVVPVVTSSRVAGTSVASQIRAKEGKK